MKNHVILLNGPSSSGKSTLSKQLQTQLEEQHKKSYAIVSIDDCMRLSTDETIYEDDVFEISGELCEKVLQALETAPGVIVDHVITSQRIFRQFQEMLASCRIHMVHVTCPLQVLLERELARKNRCLGSAEASFTYLYPSEGYDMTVDTHTMSSPECAAKILETLFV